jgi:hypothetical protein
MHVIWPGSASCLCGELEFEAPPFSADFWELMDADVMWVKEAKHAENYGAVLDETAPWTQEDVDRAATVAAEQAQSDNGATTDIARYCKICGKSEFDCVYGDQANAGFHGFDPDIPYDWDGR